MKVIFLDVDGVLNSWRNVAAFGGFPFPNETEGVHSEDNLDKLAIGMIRKLCDETGAVIVFESTWRRLTDFKEFGERHNLQIVDQIPLAVGAKDIEGLPRSALNQFGGDTTDKCWCILHWLDQHPEVKLEDWIVIDDDHIFDNFNFRSFVGEEQAEMFDSRHIQTDIMHGFTFNDFAFAFQRLENLTVDAAKEMSIRALRDGDHAEEATKRIGIWAMCAVAESFGA